ncbi:uncharacterized protein [Physcomitrium patens]|uniref:Uncharacterized protein n=1 Tax=Physcomitrium patens TaxID=3218 RepID=A0A2K1L349_PHYPA|nr:ankyrin repeat domain-containing protein 54-like [Physcomitrium patens]PNR60459.1 hypothetical protein PHYPA_003252 [Physcomitrium patens]|eukprot:XP_024399143.1 ankyrin repeat domain-containing protein 54-like [Physcomitrella patens]
MAVPVHPEDPAPDQPQTPPPVRDFLQAARYGDLEDVQRLLAQGTSVSSQDVQGRTALHMASANGHLDVVKCLIEHGANVNMCNLEQNSPLHYAVLNAHKPVVEFLISAGANVSAINRYDRTPVDEAVSKGDVSLIECITRAAPIAEEPTNGEANGAPDHASAMEEE